MKKKTKKKKGIKRTKKTAKGRVQLVSRQAMRNVEKMIETLERARQYGELAIWEQNKFVKSQR